MSPKGSSHPRFGLFLRFAVSQQGSNKEHQSNRRVKVKLWKLSQWISVAIDVDNGTDASQGFLCRLVGKKGEEQSSVLG